MIEDLLRCPVWESASDVEIASYLGTTAKNVARVRALLRDRIMSARVIGAAVVLRERLGLDDASLEDVVLLALWQATEETP